MDRDVSWLARAVGMREKTLQASVRGDRAPPGEDMLYRIAESLALKGDDLSRYYAKAVSDLSLRALLRKFPTLSEKEQAWIAAAQQRLGELLVKRTQDLRSLFWLPLLIYELEPLEFRAGKLVINTEKAVSISVPPRLCAPATGQPEYVSERLYTHLLLSDGEASRMRTGQMSKEELVIELNKRVDFEPHVDDYLEDVHPGGGVAYAHIQDIEAITYTTSPNERVRAVVDGTIERASLTWAGPPEETGARTESWLVQLRTPGDYRIVYSGLSRVEVAEGQQVARAAIIGLTGVQTITGDPRLRSLRGEEVVPIRRKHGINVFCHLGGEGYGTNQLDRAMIDSSILFPITPKTRVGSTAEQVWITEFLSRGDRVIVNQVTLGDLVSAPADPGMFSTLQFIHEPYIVLGDRGVAGDLAIALVVLLSLPVSLWRMFREVLTRTRPRRVSK